MEMISHLEDSNQRLIKQQELAEIEVKRYRKQAQWVLNISWGLIAFGVLVAVGGLFLFHPGQNHEYAEFAGGTVGPIWGLASILLIYVAFIGQKQQLIQQQLEIQYNQLELQATREELRGQKIQMEEQNNTARLQRFENTFFNLLSAFNEVSNNISFVEVRRLSTWTSGGRGGSTFSGPDETRSHVVMHKGKYASEILYNRLSEYYSDLGRYSSEELKVDKAYTKFIGEFKNQVNHFFNSFFNLVTLVDKAEAVDKDFYIKTILSQISSAELSLIFYHAKFYTEFNKKNYEVMERFRIFRQIIRTTLLKESHRDTFYSRGYFE